MTHKGLRYFEPGDVRAFAPAEGVHLRVQVADEFTILNAQIRRAFPLSNMSQYLSIRDGAGKEVGILRSVEGLDETSRNLIEEQLDRRYFTPKITRLDVVKLEAGMWRFEVLTQRGPGEFFVRNWRDSAFEISPGRWHIHSVDGGRFEIPNLEALDAGSRRLMDQLL